MNWVSNRDWSGPDDASKISELISPERKDDVRNALRKSVPQRRPRSSTIQEGKCRRRLAEMGYSSYVLKQMVGGILAIAEMSGSMLALTKLRTEGCCSHPLS